MADDDDDGGDGPLNFRRQFVDASLGHADLFGRKQLTTAGLPALAAYLLPMGVQRVPDEYWALDVNAEGYSVAIVSCPCGMTPQVEVGKVIEPCRRYEGDLRTWDPETDPLECERAYSFTGSAVYVWNSQRSKAQTAAAS